MKLFSLIFSSTIVFMVIHNDHNMSMSRATPNHNIPTIKPIKRCTQCNSEKPVTPFFVNCTHEYCLKCVLEFRISGYSCIVKDCHGNFPEGKRLCKYIFEIYCQNNSLN
ncbi:uncharacterized protein LOC126902778 [Daktulosphaira vitifoliae]|uniref:uncharacterized protein LOC126902778 n=1 Tax=Daktulosphaira vitifoliae TaxID=58002 RepID=UPI0021A9AE58|nr:uncharacterized protein LOC126902778 [Daktulosphaira vitifoliae]